MSEEEKKAIDELRKLPVTLLNCHLGGSVAIDTVLKLIEKQQKEIKKYERLKAKIHIMSQCSSDILLDVALLELLDFIKNEEEEKND